MERRAAIVTGGTGGIGSAVVERLLRRGDNVLVVDLLAAGHAKRLAEGAVDTNRGHAEFLSADVTRPEAAKEIREEVLRKFGRADILVNVAGGAGSTRVEDIDKIEIDLWDRVLEMNLKSTFLMCRELVPVMRNQQFGRIINFSSVTAAGETGPSTTVTARLPYATAKSALIGFTKQLAKDVAAYGVTVNALMPGLIVGQVGTRIRDNFEGLPAQTRDAMRRSWPTGRPGAPDEVATAVEFLSSDSASYVSGVALRVDGALL
jgi:NAD(P)-dependent dehydrogenase (short-subunit alcohol dehydrogenase family)